MPNRLIKSSVRTSTVQLTDCLSSLFSIELMFPSPELYLISPWLSDVPLVTNRFGQFRSIMPEFGKTQLPLSDILVALADKGARVRIIHRPNHQQTTEFMQRLPNTIERRVSETLHEKGLVTRHFYLRGSMNFTYSGVNLNDESVELTTDPDKVELALAEARQRWETL